MNIIIVERVRQGQQLKLIKKATSVKLARLRTISFGKLQLILDVFEAFQFRRLHFHSLSDGQGVHVMNCGLGGERISG